MYESSDFSKTKLISPSIKEINCDISVENEKKLDELLPDKDKLFIVLYLNVSGLSPSNKNILINNWDFFLGNDFDDSVRHIIIPTFDENIIEFFSLQNAKTMDLEQLIELQKRLEIKK